MRPTVPLWAPVFSYTIRNSLYIPVTSFCNCRTLPETRGQHFLLPPEVVASLLRLRDAELEEERWKFWCNWLDTQDTSSKQKLPDPPDRVLSYPFQDDDAVGRSPSAVELFEDAVSSTLKKNHQFSESQSWDSIVISGEGEPTLRIQTLLDLISLLKSNFSDTKLRLTTNGLVSEKDSESILNSGIDVISVALMTSDPHQYNEILCPMIEHGSASSSAHEIVCNFIRLALQSRNVNVELTAVERPDVDKKATEELARTLGAEKIRWRTYHP